MPFEYEVARKSYSDDEHIDLIAPVFEQIHLGLPAYPHCSPECKEIMRTGAFCQAC